MAAKSAIHGLIALSVALFCGFAQGGETLDTWKAFKAELLKMPALAVYYAFDKEDGAAVKNQASGAGKAGDNAANKGAASVEGRWPGKGALSFDNSFVEANSVNMAGSAFSVSLWLKWNGPGSVKGGNNQVNGTLIGNRGRGQGWRVTLNDRGWVDFAIGGGRETTSVDSRDLPLMKEVWQNVVCTWDGKAMRIFIQGELAGEKPYAGKCVPAEGTRSLRVGYAELGVGAMKFDVDEVAIFNAALPQKFIVRLASFHP